MSKNYGWKEQLVQGKEAEERVYQSLRDKGLDVLDLSNDTLWQARGVDAEVFHTLVDVKLDTYDNDRFFVEYMNGSHKSSGIMKTCAQYWLVYKQAQGVVYSLSCADLRLYLLENRDYLRHLTVKNERGIVAATGAVILLSEYRSVFHTGRWEIQHAANSSTDVGGDGAGNTASTGQ